MNLYKTLLVVFLVAIEYLATASNTTTVVTTGWDKTNHILAFFVLYLVLHFSFKRFSINKKVFLLILFAIQIEVVQFFIPNRYFSLLDIVADAIGIAIGIIVIYFLKRFKK